MVAFGVERDARSRVLASIGATGLGAMPGDDALETARIVVGESPDLPFLVELPQRGPWAAPDGRSTAFLAELHVDLQPAGWRLVPRPGMDERRRDSLLARDLDAIEEAVAVRTGPVKVQLMGPWSLAAVLELPRAGRVLGDAGAVRDLCAALAEGANRHVSEVRRRTGCDVVVQVDEPMLSVVLEGGVATASGLGRIAAVPSNQARDALIELVDAVLGAGGIPVAALPSATGLVELARSAGFEGIAIDLGRIDRSDDETFGAALESGMQLLAGVVEPGSPEDVDPRTVLRPLQDLWHRLGLESQLAPPLVVITPRTGLANCSPDQAKAALTVAHRTGAWLHSEPEEWVR